MLRSWGGGGGGGGSFLRTEQFNLELELFLAIHQRVEVAFNDRAFIVVLISYNYVPPISSS